MDKLKILRKQCKMRQSVRKALLIFGVEKLDTLKQPLATMTPERAVLLVVSWLAINAENGHELVVGLRRSGLTMGRAF